MTRKLIIFILTIALVLSISVPAFAATPKLKIPNVSVPNISTNVQVNVENDEVASQSFWYKWFANHPLQINWGK